MKRARSFAFAISAFGLAVALLALFCLLIQPQPTAARTLFSEPSAHNVAEETLSATMVPTDEPFTLTILHTNDTHANIQPCMATCNNQNLGGVARRYTAIQQVKAEGGNVLVVDAGDPFQGTLFFNYWQGQEASYFMNALGYQAMAIGNHEFDSGPPALARFIEDADFAVLSANIDASAQVSLTGLIEPYTIIEVGGEQIGVFGLTTEDTAFISSPGPDVIFSDVTAAAQATVAALQGMGINKIIALTHIGYTPDLALAAAVSGIDVIVGGHSHTPLGPMPGAQGDYPTVVNSPAGEPVLVVSAWEWGKYLGRLDMTFDAMGVVESYNGDPILIGASIAEDPAIAADVAVFYAPVQQLANTVFAETEVALDGPPATRTRETNLGNLICDAMLWKTAQAGSQICITNGGGIRASLSVGDLTVGNILTVLPFGNTVAIMGLTGTDVIAALENGVSTWQIVAPPGRFAQVGGMRYSFDPTRPPGDRILSADLKNANGTFTPIDPDAIYTVVTNDFLRRGGDGYTVFRDNAIDPYDTWADMTDSVMDYIQLPEADGGLNGVVTAADYPQSGEGRITHVLANIEYEALVALYNNTDGPNWANPWTLPTDEPCSLYGVTCQYGHVTELSLNVNQLNGTIPMQLGNLSNRQKLWLQNNQLIGQIPMELGNLSNLQELNLAGNGLSSHIPYEFGQLNSLHSLWLEYNQLTGEIPGSLGNLGSLQRLWLGNNQLSGEIPPELGNLSNLEVLRLHGNQLTGQIPPQLGNLASLQWLQLGPNQLSGEIPSHLGNLSSLRHLQLGQNQLDGTIPPELGQLSNLTMLFLGYNQLSGQIPAEFGNLSSLRRLELMNNALSGEIPSELGSLTNLELLDLHANQLNGEIPAELGNLSSLQGLNLWVNQLTGAIPAELGNLINLQYLYLNQNQLSGQIPPELGNLTNLQELSIHDNQLSGAIPSELSNLAALRALNLSHNALGGPVPESMTQLPLTGDPETPNGQYGWWPFIGFDYNMLWADDPDVAAFLDEKDPGWDETQTVAPADLAAIRVGDDVQLSWTPIAYTGDGGHYEVGLSATPGGPYTVIAQTDDKSAVGITILGLEAGFVAVRTYTPAHGQNQNALRSPYSNEVLVDDPTVVTLASLSATPTPLPLPASLPLAALPAMASLALGIAYILRRRE